MDDNVKKQVEKLFADRGLTMGTVVNMFIRQTIRQQGIPFEVTAKSEPFYSAENQTALLKSIKDYESSKSEPIIKKMDELKAMEDE